MDIEIINTDKSEQQRKDYIKKQFEITSIQDKINARFLMLDKSTCLDNRELVKELIDTVVELTFYQGQSFGKEKIIYKKIGGLNDGINSEDVYKKRSDHYVGD